MDSAETHTISVIFLRTNNIFLIYINSLIVDFRIIYNFYFFHFSLLFEKYKGSVEVRVQWSIQAVKLKAFQKLHMKIPFTSPFRIEIY